MLSRRFVLVSMAFLFLLLVGGLLIMQQMTLVTQGQSVALADEVALQEQLQHQAAQQLSCPDAPPVYKGIVYFDFCSPKYVGNAAGPFGSHFVLAGENLPGTPAAWLMTKDQPISSSQESASCLTHLETICYIMPQPFQSSSQETLQLFGWTWQNGFPTTPGNYFITAVFGSLTSHNTQFIPTPIPFTLLSSQPPCITLSANHQVSTNCSSSQQSFSIHLTATNKLTLHGSYWSLGWNKNPIAETIQITATCSSQSCHPGTLFTTTVPANAIAENGRFSLTVSLPRYASGTYQVTAADAVPQVVTPGVLDNKSSNTIADGSLTFGQAGDAIALNITAIPSIPPGPLLVFDTTALNVASVVIAIPALLGIIAFFIIWNWQRSALKYQPQFPGSTPPNAVSPIDQIGASTPTTIQSPENLAVFFPLIPFPPIVTSQQGRFQRSESNLNKRSQKAIKQWEKEQKLDKAFNVASQLLFYDIEKWKQFIQTLNNTDLIVSDETTMKIGQRVFAALQQIQATKDSKQLQLLFSTALTCNNLLLARPLHPQQRANLLFCTGFIYTSLALTVPTTATTLIHSAFQFYTQADQLYMDQSNQELHVRTQIAFGDAYVVKAATLGIYTDDPTRSLKTALNYYQSVLPYIPDFQLSEVQRRITIIQNRLSGPKRM